MGPGSETADIAVASTRRPGLEPCRRLLNELGKDIPMA